MADGDEIRYFEEITRVPRPSGHTDRIGAYLERFAKAHGLPCVRDASGNILIRRPGKGVTVTLQAHQDMVPTCTSGSSFDFVNCPLETYIDDGWIRARGTTLGADDGSGIAIAMCALTDPELEGLSIEALFTVDEEIGLLGALELERNSLNGEYLVNIDSEDVRELTIGCAGSTDVTFRFPGSRDVSEGYFYRLQVSGCSGGHSAGEIDKDRVNAVVLTFTVLSKIAAGARIVAVDGGNAPNAIPMSCRVDFCCECKLSQEEIEELVQQLAPNSQKTDPDMSVTLSTCEPSPAFSESLSAAFTEAVVTVPNGPLDRDGFGVKTSSNVGVVSSTDSDLVLVVKPRSSDMRALDALISQQVTLCTDLGATCDEYTVLPAWREDPSDPFIITSVSTYRDVFGRDPVVTVTHGGLECSVIRERNPGIKGAISVGPTIIGAHSPEECMDVRTLSQTKAFVYGLLSRLCR